MTHGRPEGTADGYHFNDFSSMEDRYRGNAIARTVAQVRLGFRVWGLGFQGLHGGLVPQQRHRAHRRTVFFYHLLTTL